MDLQRENTELVSSVSRLEAGRRESVSSGEGEFSHTKEASVLSDSSFEAATTKTTGSSSGVSSDLSDSDNDVSSDQSDPGTQSPSQVRRLFLSTLSVQCLWLKCPSASYFILPPSISVSKWHNKKL